MLNFLIFDHILCLYKRMFLFLGNTLTKTGIKAHSICNLISNDLEKIVHGEVEDQTKRRK